MKTGWNGAIRLDESDITFIDRNLLHFKQISGDEILIRRKTIIEILSEPNVYRTLINQSL